MKHHRGFTLIEILLATAILAAGMAIAFATIHAATLIGQRDESSAAELERMRSVERFFRQSLMRALPLSMGLSAKQEQTLFIGSRDHLRFVSELADGLGRGGTYVFDLFAVSYHGHIQLRLAVSPRLANQPVQPADMTKSEVIADDLRQVQFHYRGINNRMGAAGPWLDEWTHDDRLPVIVAMQIADEARSWPEMIVALPAATALEVGS